VKATDLSYSRKFESLQLYAQIKFYGISKFTDQAKSSEHFLKNISRGPDLPGTGRNSADVQCAGKRCVHASEWLCRSRRPEHAREGTERGLEDGQWAAWAAWAASSHWASTAAARGLRWRGRRGQLDFCALVGMSMRGVASGCERGEG
jgi:hypothetical protein